MNRDDVEDDAAGGGHAAEPEDSDAALMRIVGGGDRGESAEAFGEIVQRYHERMVNFFYRSLRDRHLAEDFASEVFLRLYRAAGSYRPEAKFTTFLYRIAKNYLIDHYRVQGNRPRSLSLDYSGAAGNEAGEDGPRLSDRLAGPDRPPEAPLDNAEIGELVLDAIHRLPEDHRLVVLMSEIEGMKYADISEALEIPVGTVKSRMFTAYGKLREMLRHHFPEFGEPG